MMNARSELEKKILDEIHQIPEAWLPKLLEVIMFLKKNNIAAIPQSGEQVSAEIHTQVDEIIARAKELAQERKHWSREQHFEELFKVMAEIRQDAIARGVAFEKDEDAASV
jgi:hypothetical protein